MIEIEHCCGTCLTWEPARNPKTGRVLPSEGGECTYMVDWSQMPACYRSRFIGDLAPRRHLMRSESSNCPCWQPNEKTRHAMSKQVAEYVKALADAGRPVVEEGER